MRDVASLTSPALVPIFLQDILVAVNILVKAVLILVCIYDLICICILYFVLYTKDNEEIHSNFFLFALFSICITI